MLPFDKLLTQIFAASFGPFVSRYIAIPPNGVAMREYLLSYERRIFLASSKHVKECQRLITITSKKKIEK